MYVKNNGQTNVIFLMFDYKFICYYYCQLYAIVPSLLNSPCVYMENHETLVYMIQISSGIASGRVVNWELYAQRLQKLIYLHLLTGCFMKISLQSSEQNSFFLQNSEFCCDDWREILVKQPVSKCRSVNFCNLWTLVYIILSKYWQQKQ